MVKGFNLELQDYCSYCGDFEAHVDKIDIGTISDNVSGYMTTIGCKHAYKCARICENMRRRECNQ